MGPVGGLGGAAGTHGVLEGGDDALATRNLVYLAVKPHLELEHSVLGEKRALALERHRSTLVEHAAITEALKSHDAERVQAAIQTHIESSMKALYVSMGD